MISLNQDEWLKRYIEINNKLRTESKSEFEKYFFKLINKPVLGKTMESQRKYRDINLSRVKEEEIIWSQSQIIIPQTFSPKICLQ